MSKEKQIIRVAYLGLDAKINHKELDEIKKAHPDCDVRVCLINTDFHSRFYPPQRQRSVERSRRTSAGRCFLPV